MGVVCREVPQITDLTISLTSPIENARFRVTLADADEKFGSTTLDIGPIPAGTSTFRRFTFRFRLRPCRRSRSVAARNA